MSITCFIRYQIDPFQVDAFEEYARVWGEAIPRCGADLVGYFAPYEGSSTTAYGVYHIEDLAAYDAYRRRLAEHPLGRDNYQFARDRRFILKEDRTFLGAPRRKHVGVSTASDAACFVLVLEAPHRVRLRPASLPSTPLTRRNSRTYLRRRALRLASAPHVELVKP